MSSRSRHSRRFAGILAELWAAARRPARGCRTNFCAAVDDRETTGGTDTGNAGEQEDDDKVRLDKWLWAARFFKTRALAKAAIEGGDRCIARAKRFELSKEPAG